MLRKTKYYLQAGITIVLVMFLLTGCVTRKEILQFKADHQEITGQQKVAEKQLDDLDIRLTKLEARLDTLFSLLGGDVSTHFANQEEILRSMRADQRSVNSELQTLIETLAARISDSDVHTRRLAQKLDEVNLLITEIVSEKDSTRIDKTFDVNDPEKLYHQSYLDLSQGENELARMGFQMYLSQYPKTSLSDNAWYWIGESFLAEGKQDSAKFAFEQVEKKYPQENKVAASLLKLGIVNAAEGNKEVAKTYFQKVIKNHKGSPEANQAEARLKELEE